MALVVQIHFSLILIQKVILAHIITALKYLSQPNDDIGDHPPYIFIQFQMSTKVPSFCLIIMEI